MNFLVANLAKSTRFEILQGRRYLVAPVALITEGVHAGSNGPLLYRAEEIQRAIPAWNMKPIVVYHPEKNGKGISAADPIVLEKQQVGVLMNVHWDGKKLRAEAWIETSRAGLVDSRILESLEAGKIMEVSTGLFTDNAGGPGNWNGEDYVAEAINHQPDHLALLPDQVGACSIADGAGLLQTNRAKPSFGRIQNDLMDALPKYLGIKPKPDGPRPWVLEVFDGFFIYDTPTGLGKMFRLDYSVSDSGVEISGQPVEISRVTEYRETESGKFVGNMKPETLDPKKERTQMDKKSIVDALISNSATAWQEEDRAGLMELEETFLAKLVTPAPPVANTAPKIPAATPSLESFLASAPPEFRDVLTNGLAAHNAAKTALIDRITGNARNKFSREFLASKPIQELQGIAALAFVESGPGEVPMFYGGASIPSAPPVANAVTEEPLLLPTINFRPVA